VIAAVLQNPNPHDRQVYPLFGAEELDYGQIAAKVQQILGLPTRYEPIDLATYAAGLVASGATGHLVQHLTNVAQDYRDGIFAGINNLVEVIGGSKPMTIEEYVTANRAKFDADGYLAITDDKLDTHGKPLAVAP
jgi:hypothetical protein